MAYFQVWGGLLFVFVLFLFFIKNMVLHSTSSIFFYDVTCTSEKAESFNTGTPHWHTALSLLENTFGLEHMMT